MPDSDGIRAGARVSWQLTPLLLTTLLISIALKLVTLPINRILENKYCVQHYLKYDPSLVESSGYVDETHCKIDSVQQQLGWMTGMLETVTLACDILSTTPLAYAADQKGRRGILLLNILAMVLRVCWIMFAVQALIPDNVLLVGIVFTIFGGGVSVTTSILLAMTSGIAQTDLERPAFISWFNSAQFSAGLLGPALASALMRTSLWSPIWTAVGLLLVPLCLLSFLPDRDGRPSLKRRSSNEYSEASPLLDQDGNNSPAHDSSRLNHNGEFRLHDFARSYWSLIASSKRFQLLLLSFFFTGIASSSSVLFPLFLSQRFGWTFAQVGVIFALKAIVNLTMSIIIVPAYSRYMSSRSEDADQLACTSALLVSIIGAIMIALSATKWQAILSLCIYAVGSVISTFMYAITRAAGFDKDSEARGYALIVLTHEFGRLIGTPLMSFLWYKLLVSSYAKGAPFLLSAVAYLACLYTVKRAQWLKEENR